MSRGFFLRADPDPNKMLLPQLFDAVKKLDTALERVRGSCNEVLDLPMGVILSVCGRATDDDSDLNDLSR